MSTETLMTLDQAIAQKRRELKELLQEELDELIAARDGIRFLGHTPPLPAARATPAPALNEPAAPAPASTPADRLGAIKSAAEKLSGVKTRRQNYSDEFKLLVVDDYERAPRGKKQEVLKKHGISWQSVMNWRQDVADGKLVRP